MTNNFTEYKDGLQYFICEYCILLADAKKRVKLLCDKGKKAFYKHSNNDYIVYARC